MARIRIIGLCVVAAAFAMSTMAAAPASAAEPVFEHEIVMVTPLTESEKVLFTAASKKATLETVQKEKIVCASSSAQGSILGPSGISLSVAFKGCEELGSKCTSAGAAEGEILTNVFEGKLGNLKSGSTPGVALFQPKEHENDAEFVCGTTSVEIFGGVVGPITTVGKLVTKLSLTYKSTAGIQLFESLFGGPLEVLAASFGRGKAEQAGLTATDVLTLSQPLEIS